MQLYITHTTRYDYPNAVSESHNEVRLMPLTDGDQACRQFALLVDPPAVVHSYEEPGGAVHFFNLRMRHDRLTIRAQACVETWTHDPFARLDLVSQDLGFYSQESVRQEFAEYLSPTTLVPAHPEAAHIAQTVRAQEAPNTAGFLIALTRWLGRVLTYAPGETDVRTNLDQFLQEKRGVCQDFAHLMLAACRSQGIPARYVSGYGYGGAGVPSASLDQVMHAWVECLMPGGAWRGFDPTNSLVVNDHYVKAHVGRDYADVAPVRGVYRGSARHQLHVSVRVSEGAPPDIGDAPGGNADDPAWRGGEPTRGLVYAGASHDDLMAEQ